MTLLKKPQGTLDLLPDGSPKVEPLTSARWHRFITEKAREVLERAGAQFIGTPMFEEPQLVQRGVGGSTDIVRKEMFTVYYFGEHGGYVLRPEGTASVVRAYLENGLKQLPSPLRLWTAGPMFRAERNQRGRYRQFHQVDYEAIGGADAILDAEAIALMVSAIEALGVRGAVVKLGSVGDPWDREGYNAYLRDLFGAHVERLSEDSRDRLQRNPMRILDSKDKGDQALIAEVQPKAMLDFLGEEAAAHFAEVRAYLDAWGVTYEVDPSIVRGLDYYRRTAWEVHHANIGAKSALGGGGRYDGLAEELGGPATPAVGWAFGVERLILAMQEDGVEVPQADGPLVFVAALDAEHVASAARLAMDVRAVGRAEFAAKARKPRAAVEDAVKRGARYAAVIGSDEAQRGTVTLRDLQSGEQTEVRQADLAGHLAGLLAGVKERA